MEAKLTEWGLDGSLLDPTHFARRMQILDQLEILFASGRGQASYSPDLVNTARDFIAKLESANTLLFESIRCQIQTGICPAEFVAIMRDLVTPPLGLAYDYLDDLLAGVFQFEPPTEEPRPLDPDSVFYQPTPARHIFHLITAAAITSTDTLIDLGSGLGHVPLLVSICNGATSIGIELDPTWVASARKCADSLNLRNATFRVEDARETDLSSGTVFYLYTPFGGSILAIVFDALREQGARRPIRICTFGPCTGVVSKQPWLQPLTPPTTDRITVFLPRP